MRTSFIESPYSKSKHAKSVDLLSEIQELNELHREQCIEYERVCSNFFFEHDSSLESQPFLPVSIFKNMQLQSVANDEVFKVLTSSGTTSQTVSKIVLDRETASYQSKALVSIMTHFVGKSRLPMLIIDHENVIKDRKSFSARGAGVLGFSNFGRDHTYALDEDMSLQAERVFNFLKKHEGQPILLFGFTFMVWQYFLQEAIKKNIHFDLSKGILIHGGGWKKLADLKIDNNQFKKKLSEQFGLVNVHNYYGMVEQVGSIFMECEAGYYHTPNFADVIIRDPATFEPLARNEVGLIQVISTLPRSYPGHSLLTEDLGSWFEIDDCPCGMKGKTFHVHGRLPKAELRGCSDTHAFDAKKK